MHHLCNAVLLLLTLPVVLATPKPASIQSREPEPMFTKQEASPAKYGADNPYFEVNLGEAVPRPPPKGTAAEASEGALIDKMEYSMEARPGLFGTPLYNAKGEQLNAGLIPLNEDKTKVMLLHMPKFGRPFQTAKGAWESKETATHAAQRKGWENGGIKTTDLKYIGEIARWGRSGRWESTYFQCVVEEAAEEWPLKADFERGWFTYAEAMDEFAKGERFDMAEMLKRSEIKRPFVPTGQVAMQE